jgi:hypothetical protein
MSIFERRINLGCGSWIRIHRGKRYPKSFTVEIHRGRGEGGLISVRGSDWRRDGKIIFTKKAVPDLLDALTQIQLELKP